MRPVRSILMIWLVSVCLLVPALALGRPQKLPHTRVKRHARRVGHVHPVVHRVDHRVARRRVVRHAVVRRHARVSRHAVRYRRHVVRSRHTSRYRHVAARSHSHTAARNTRRRKPVAVAHRRAESAAAGISPARATQIQNALIRAGYLQHGSGSWDAETTTALRRYQQDHHWQARVVPDARALIALGLGPRRDQSSLYPAVADTAPPALAEARDDQPPAGGGHDSP